MKFPAHMMTVDTVEEDNGYLDVRLTDRGRNGLKRYWRISKDLDTNEWYGVLLRSETVEDGFEWDVNLPEAAIEALVTLYGAWLDAAAAKQTGAS